jgi:iron complex transport system permease protein
MGSLAGVGWDRLVLAAPVCLASVVFLVVWRWRITALSLDEGVAASLGLRPARERWAVLAVASAGVAAMVAVAGVVGWIGLAVPHAARLVAGADARRSMPMAVLLGGAFAVVCDTVARAALPGELPLGAVTAVLGAGLFVALLAGGRSGVWR